MKTSLLPLTLLTVSGLTAPAALSISLPGNSVTEGWDQLVGSRLSGFGNHPGLAPWPDTIAPNLAGSNGEAAFGKSSGGGYLGTQSFYDGGTSGGLFIDSGDPIANLATLVFQIDMGADSFSTSPQLLVNGSTLLAPIAAAVTPGEFSFSFGGPPVQTQNHAFQWDLSGMEAPITAYQVQWETAPRTTIYQLQLDAGDTFIQVIPEPSAALLALLASPFLLRRKRNTPSKIAIDR